MPVPVPAQGRALERALQPERPARQPPAPGPMQPKRVLRRRPRWPLWPARPCVWQLRSRAIGRGEFRHWSAETASSPARRQRCPWPATGLTASSPRPGRRPSPAPPHWQRGRPRPPARQPECCAGSGPPSQPIPCPPRAPPCPTLCRSRRRWRWSLTSVDAAPRLRWPENRCRTRPASAARRRFWPPASRCPESCCGARPGAESCAPRCRRRWPSPCRSNQSGC